jgi:Fe-S-cluster-containing dehydrogenase component
MIRYGLVIDSGRSIGCYNCFLACRDEHAGNDHPPIAAGQPDSGQNWIDVQVHERGSFPKVKVSYVPMPCQHCVEAPCIGASKEGAVYQRADGIVLIDPDKAAGQFDIVGSCPYGAVFWNEAKRMPQKCTLCAHLLDAGRGVPRCVEACPTGALVFGDRNDPNSAISTLDFRRRAEPLHPEYGKPARGILRIAEALHRWRDRSCRRRRATGAWRNRNTAARQRGICADNGPLRRFRIRRPASRSRIRSFNLASGISAPGIDSLNPGRHQRGSDRARSDLPGVALERSKLAVRRSWMVQ